jgi:enoyl-CoA hydratase/carnithine racemase
MALEAFLSVERSETIAIAAVNGIAYGGGTELTLACDLAHASTEARFAFREVTLGLMPGYGLVRGPELIGRGWTHRLALSGEIIDAAQAQAIGLVQEVTEPARLVPDTLALAARIAAHPPLALRAVKRFVNRHSAAGIAESIEATALLMADEERRALVRRFLDR